MKNAKTFFVKTTTQKISEKEALKLYFDLLIPGIAVLEELKGKARGKRNNILNALKKINLESAFYWCLFKLLR